MWRIARAIAALVVIAAVMLAIAVHVAPTHAQQNEIYVVLYKQPAVPDNAATAIQHAGGTFLYGYDQLGIAFARSSADGFRGALLRDQQVEGVAATSRFERRIDQGQSTPSLVSANRGPAGSAVNALATDALRGPVTLASIGGMINPDAAALRSQLDAADSVSCSRGFPDTDAAAWTDHQGQGTASAATLLRMIKSAEDARHPGIARAATGNIKIAAIRVTDDDGDVSPQAMICAFAWAGAHRLTAAGDLSGSLLLTCRDDPQQRTLWYAEQRALTFAEQQGVTPLLANSSAGNATPAASPADNSDDVNACVVISTQPKTGP